MASTRGQRAAIYTRISADKNGEGAGVERQEKDCRALAEANGWEVVEVYCDNDVSAFDRRKKRPAFDRMMTDAAAGGLDIVMAWATDRLYRRPVDLERVVDALNISGVRVATVKSGDIDLGTADGRANARILGTMSMRESEKIAERVSAAAKQRAEKGRYTLGRRLFGWTDGSEPHPTEAPAVAAMYDAFLAGSSLSAIARGIAAQGFTTTEGRTPGQSDVSRWLKHPLHAGLVTYKGAVVAQSDGIVDRSTWDRAQAILSDPARRPKRGRPHSSLLGGLMSCAACGSPMKPGSARRAEGMVKFYVCKPHRHASIRRDQADTFVTEALAEYVALNVDGIREHMERPDGTVPLKAEAERLRQQLRALAVLLREGNLDALDFAEATSAIRPRLAEVEERIGQEAGMTATAALLSSGDAAEAVRGLDRERFRALFQELVASAVVPCGGGVPTVSWVT